MSYNPSAFDRMRLTARGQYLTTNGTRHIRRAPNYDETTLPVDTYLKRRDRYRTLRLRALLDRG